MSARPLLACLILCAAAAAAEHRPLMVWNGEDHAGGKGWRGPERPENSIAVDPGGGFNGGSALRWQAEGAEWLGCIWNWHGWYPAGAGDSIAGHANLAFRIKVVCSGDPGNLAIGLGSADGATKQAAILDYCPEAADGTWHEVVIPLADLPDAGKFDPARVWQFALNAWAPGSRKLQVWIDDIAFDDRKVRPLGQWVREPEPRPAQVLAGEATAVAASIDPAAAIPVSPWIYGVAMADPALCHEIGAPARRCGGNPLSPVSWKLGFGAKGADWFFENEGTATPPEKNWIVTFHGANRAAGLESYLSIPLMGRVAKDGTSCAFPLAKYPGQESWAGKTQPRDRMPEAGNGRRARIGPDGAPVLKDGKPVIDEIRADPDDTSVAMPVEEQCAILKFIAEDMRQGRAGAGGVRWVALDNEPALWSSTHRGMRPDGVSYDELWTMTSKAGAALKAIDPGVKVAGPTAWGWTEYFTSGRDAQLCGSGKASWNAPPDFTAHGGIPFGKWYLQQVAAAAKAGVQPVDILDWHFYPQTGHYMGGKRNDPATMESRVQETRVLWDPAWVDPSWMGRGAIEVPHMLTRKPGVIALIRLMHQWIDDAGLAGRMQVALGEYNFGGEGDVSGGIAQAELFGVFARERVDHAYLWFAPAPNSSLYFAWKLLRNPDGKGTAVGSEYLPAAVDRADDVSLHVYRDAAGKRLSLVAINKRAGKLARLAVRLPVAIAAQQATVWEYGGSDIRCIGLLPPRPVGGPAIDLELPPLTAQRIDLRTP